MLGNGHLPEPTIEEEEAEAAEVADTSSLLTPSYLTRGWATSADIYHATLDLKSFYPRISLQEVMGTIITRGECDNSLADVLKSLDHFPLVTAGVANSYLKECNLGKDQKFFFGLPTGLLAAGFLANVAMIDVDIKVNQQLPRSVAHFRFVDDHAVLAQDVDSLISWLNSYKDILSESDHDLEISREKGHPSSIIKELCNGTLTSPKKGDKKRSQIVNSLRIDPLNPTNIITSTLAKVSAIAHTNVRLLDEDGQSNLLRDLRQLLLTDFPEDEIKPSTRVSFATTALVRTLAALVALDDQHEQFHSEQSLFESPATNFTNTDSKVTLPLDKAIRRVRHLILRAIDTHPSKVSIWNRSVQFAACCDPEILLLVLEKIELLKAKAPVKSYLKSYVLQAISFELQRLAKADSDLSLSQSELNYAHNFKQQAKVASERLRSRLPKRSPFVDGNLLCSCLIAYRCDKDADLYNLSNGLTSKAPFIRGIVEEFKFGGDDRLPNSVQDMLTSFSNDSNDPAVALTLARSLPYLSASRAISLLDDNNIRLHQPEVISSFETLHISADEARRSNILAEWILAMGDARELSLIRWSSLITSLDATSFNPAASEWTCLEIVRQIAVLQKNHSKLPLHPARFRIPIDAVPNNEGFKGGWVRWHEHCRQHLRLSDTETQIRDSRYRITIDGDLTFDDICHGLGMILLGLLRGSFIWPISGGNTGTDRCWSQIAQSALDQLVASSYSTALVSALLSNKAVEGRLRRLKSTDLFDGDYASVQLTNLDSIINIIDMSKERLSNLQIETGDDNSVQITTIMIRQGSANPWSQDGESLPELDGEL